MNTSVSFLRGGARLWLGVVVLMVLLPLAAQADDYADVSRLVGARQFKEALTKADQFLASKPRDPQMRFIRGVILSESGRNIEAISVFNKITEDFPELPEPYNNLAVLHAAQNQYDKARAALEMAIRTNPSYATAHENLGDVYARLASQAYSKALQLDANNTAVQPKLALIRTLFNPDPKSQRLPAPAAQVPPPVVAAAPAPPALPAAPTPSAPPAATAPPRTAQPAPAVPPAVVAAPNAAVASSNIASASDSLKPTQTANAEVDTAVRRWASAWSSKDLDTYFGAYARNFDTPGKLSRQDWEEERKSRILSKSKISVQLSDVVIAVNGNEATVRFRQAYSADTLNVTSRKTLQLVLTGDRWLIVRESVAG